MGSEICVHLDEPARRSDTRERGDDVRSLISSSKKKASNVDLQFAFRWRVVEEGDNATTLV